MADTLDMRSFAKLVPLQYWGRPDKPATFLDAEPLGPAAAALCWSVSGRFIYLVWDYPANRDETLDAALRQFPDADAIAVVGGDFNALGPSLYAVLPGAPERPAYEPSWSALANTLGGPVPYWPFALRIPDLISSWRPGSEPVTAAATPVLDPSAPLQLAALLDQDGAAHKTLVNLVRTWQTKAAEDARMDIRAVQERSGARPGTLTLAAVPLEYPAVSAAHLEETVRRAGWLEILDRADYLAALCVRLKIAWDGGADLPHGQAKQVSAESVPGREWSGRLVPAARTARAELLDTGRTAAEVLVDPETDAPVIRRRDGSMLAATPGRLPTASPLAEIVLEGPVWVRTEDGTLWLAPHHHYYGLSWGYSGSGPGSLALLIHRLLDDISAPPADAAVGAEDGLEELTQMKWPEGTVLTRAQLEAARRGDLPDPPTAGDDA